MPSTPKQMRTAGRELRRRRAGEVKQEKNRATATRPMGAMSEENLRKYAGYPLPNEQRRAAMTELVVRETGRQGLLDPNRAFGKASKATVEFYATATDDEMRKRNGQT